MFLSGFILFLANVLHVFGGTEYPELNYVPSVGNDSLNKTKRDNVGLAHVLDFFNTETLTANWELVRRNLTGFCDKDLQKYIKGLGDHEQWALKSKFSFVSPQFSILLKLKIKLLLIVFLDIFIFT